MKNCYTKKQCDDIISKYKGNTAYFGEPYFMRYDEIYDMLRYRMQFGEAETQVIIASLIKCGAKIPN